MDIIVAKGELVRVAIGDKVFHVANAAFNTDQVEIYIPDFIEATITERKNYNE